MGAAHVARLHPPLLAHAAQQGAAVRAEATVTGDPRVHLPASDGGRPMAPSWSVPARLSAVVVRGRTYSVRVPVSLRGDEVRHLRYGSRISLSGRASESFSPEAQSLTLRVLGPVHVRSPPGAVARVTTADPRGLPGSLRRAAGRRRGAPARAGRRRRVHPSRGSRRGDGPCRPGPPHRCQRLEHVAGRRHRDGCGGGTRAGLAGPRRHVPGGAVGVRDACQAPAQRAACRRHGGGRPRRALGRGSPSRSAGAARLGAGPPARAAAVRPLAGVRAVLRGHRRAARGRSSACRTTGPVADHLVDAGAVARRPGSGGSSPPGHASPGHPDGQRGEPGGPARERAGDPVGPVRHSPRARGGPGGSHRVRTRCRAGHPRLTGDGGDRVGGSGFSGPAVRRRRGVRGPRRRRQHGGRAGARRPCSRPRMATVAGPADQAAARRVRCRSGWCSTTTATRAGHPRRGWSSPATWARATGC